MPIAVYTKLEGAGRSPAPEGAQEVQEMQEVQERPVGATGEASERRPYAGPQDCRPPEYWDGATCGDCKFFDPKTETCGGNPDSPTIAGLPADWCFLWEPRRAEP